MTNKTLKIDAKKIQAKDPDELVKLVEYLTPLLREMVKGYLPAISIDETTEIVHEALYRILSNIYCLPSFMSIYSLSSLCGNLFFVPT